MSNSPDAEIYRIVDSSPRVCWKNASLETASLSFFIYMRACIASVTKHRKGFPKVLPDPGDGCVPFLKSASNSDSSEIYTTGASWLQ